MTRTTIASVGIEYLGVGGLHRIQFVKQKRRPGAISVEMFRFLYLVFFA
jgi:hypothetical protein